MNNHMYWVSALTYALILIIILLHEGTIKNRLNEVSKAYRNMAIWVVIFCLHDAVWGLCDCNVIKGDMPFFISSSLFHFFTAVTTYYWIKFTLTYIEASENKKRVFTSLVYVVIGFELFLVISNIFIPILFRIENGRYVTGRLRSFSFFNQYIVYIVCGITALIFAIKERKGEKEKFWSVFVYTLAPIFLGAFQLLYPEAPLYSLGYFIGCFVVHIFIVASERDELERAEVMSSIAATYYSMHLVDLESNTLVRYIEPEILTGLIGDTTNAQEMINRALRGTVSDKYLDMVMEFADLSTIPARMSDSNLITSEFEGRNYGWTRINFVAAEKKNNVVKKIMLVTQIIDAEKRKQMDLLFKSNNDELTGLYNRRAFENDVLEKKSTTVEDNLVLISLDVNELKIVNDSFGHAAGDELLLGAAQCMKECLGPYGKIYRTGGDEFYGVIYATSAQLEGIKRDFDDAVTSWKGSLVDHLSVSTGYVCKNDIKELTISGMLKLADEKMYENKALYYKAKGLDRRGQRDAHTALCALYTKILKINITEDSYQIINMDVEETNRAGVLPSRISSWMSNFGKEGNVHPDDLEGYLSQTNITYMRDYFSRGKSSLSIFYRRKEGEKYKQYMMEIIPANDYSADNQNLYLYVKKIDK